MSNPELQSKQMQLMMNLSLLSSLKNKPCMGPVPIYQPQIPMYPIIQAPHTLEYIYPPTINMINPGEPKILTQLSYHSMMSPHSTLMSYPVDDQTPVQTNDTSYGYIGNNGFYIKGGQKSYTTMSYHVPPQQFMNQNEFYIGKKTTRNTIIINNEIEKEDENKEKEGYVKHHSAPITLLSNQNNSKTMFETHLLKKQIEVSEDDKKYNCGHEGCDLSYKTKKQKVSHHGKMDPECQKDSINLLKNISNVKDLLLSLYKKDKIKYKDIEGIKEKFEKTMRDISINEYAQMICGYKLNIAKPINDNKQNE